jgi:hypothetical protein
LGRGNNPGTAYRHNKKVVGFRKIAWASELQANKIRKKDI